LSFGTSVRRELSRCLKPASIAGFCGAEVQKQAKIGDFVRKPKKTVENTLFSIDFDHLEAAL